MSDPQHPNKPANHTHRECWVFKQSGKLNAVHKGEDTPSADEDEPPKQDTGEQKKFPPEVKTVNVLHVIKGRNKTALPKKYAQGPITAESCHWSSQPITFDHRGYSASIRRAGWDALVLDPIIDGYHFTRVLMDGGNSLNLIYQDTVRKMGIDPTKISHSNTTFKGVILGPEARCTGSLLLEVVFGSPDNFRSEKLIFDIAPFRSGYQALLGRTAFARFNAISLSDFGFWQTLEVRTLGCARRFPPTESRS
jgi:hypothetical protein